MESRELFKTDKNGTKYYVDHACPKCHGKGYIPYYGFNYNGVCFKCGGSGNDKTHSDDIVHVL